MRHDSQVSRQLLAVPRTAAWAAYHHDPTGAGLGAGAVVSCLCLSLVGGGCRVLSLPVSLSSVVLPCPLLSSLSLHVCVYACAFVSLSLFLSVCLTV
jgi:hypothetical protein